MSADTIPTDGRRIGAGGVQGWATFFSKAKCKGALQAAQIACD